jgi:hypothetical protein
MYIHSYIKYKCTKGKLVEGIKEIFGKYNVGRASKKDEEGCLWMTEVGSASQILCTS